MSFRDDLLGVLSGGLPALLDGPSVQGTTSQTVVPVEEVAPSGTIRDREPFLLNANLTSRNILFGTAAIIGVIALVMIVRR